MSIRFCKYGMLLPVLALGATAACEHSPTTANGPSSVSASLTMGPSVGFEPATLRPEPVPGTSCVAGPPFGTRIIIVVNAGGDVVLRGLRFRFTDRSGLNALPRVTPISGSTPMSVPASAIPPLGPIPYPGVAPLPTGAPVQIPGSGPMDGLMVPTGTSLRLPYYLRFDCGLAPEGTLTVFTDMVKPKVATPVTSEFRVRVGN